MKSLKLAKAGNVVEQRNVAVSYDSGYMVNPCPASAYYWYKKAAKGGDEIAIEWVSRNETLSALMNGSECVGTGCRAADADSATAGIAYAEEGGHFFAPLTVNGKTIRGMIDTGATIVALNKEAAAELEIDFSQGEKNTSGTANGAMVNSIVTVPKLTVAGVSLDNVQVSCCINHPVSLIGMSYLSRVHFSVTGDIMSIQK